MTWVAIAVTAVSAYAFKALGFFGLSRITPRGVALRAVAVLPAALFASLVISQVIEPASATIVWTRAVGVAAGGAAAWRRLPLLAVIAAAGGTAAVLRLLT